MAPGVQTNFRAQDMRGSRATAKTKVKAAPEPDPDPDLVVEPETEADGEVDSSHRVFVPDGTVEEIMAWVGSDKTLAQAAKDKELANDHPRTTLLSRLDSLMND